MNDILAKFFGSAGRVKVIRLFLLNPEEIFTPKEIIKRAKLSPLLLKKELSLLSGTDFILKKKKLGGWMLNPSFPLITPLKRLVINVAPFSRADILKKITKSGGVKLIILSGIFIQDDNSRVDLLVVGDRVNKSSLERVFRQIEAEVGKELNYAVLTTQDFFYRLGVYDKFIRDILDYPHEKILNKLGV